MVWAGRRGAGLWPARMHLTGQLAGLGAWGWLAVQQYINSACAVLRRRGDAVRAARSAATHRLHLGPFMCTLTLTRIPQAPEPFRPLPPPPRSSPPSFRYDGSAWSTEGGDVALGHITNYAQNMDGTVWDLQQLQEHMGACCTGAALYRTVLRGGLLGRPAHDGRCLTMAACGACVGGGACYMHACLLRVPASPCDARAGAGRAQRKLRRDTAEADMSRPVGQRGMAPQPGPVL